MKTLLYAHHLALGAQMVSFAGWEMPLSYRGILMEHQAVREAVGLFDVSHMTRIHVYGSDAENLLDYLSTNRITGKLPDSVTYTVWCNAEGGSIDDLLIYKVNEAHFLVIGNAINRDKDLNHLKKMAKMRDAQVEIHSEGEESGILALQGPYALPLLQLFIPHLSQLKPMHFFSLNDKVYVSGTGYTGAGGFEIYGPAKDIQEWWDRLLGHGQAFGLQPIGLGARDTLRLEMGFALYGHELAETIGPHESVAAWTIKWDKPDFFGKQALSEKKRFPYAIQVLNKGIARQGHKVIKDGNVIGEVTSGTFSPSLTCGIALILVEETLNIGEEISVEIRQKPCFAHVVELPFVRKKA